MPTIFDIFGLKGFFPAGDHEPPHIHVISEDGVARIKVSPQIELMSNTGMKPKDLRRAMNLVEEYREEIIKIWKVYHS